MQQQQMRLTMPGLSESWGSGWHTDTSTGGVHLPTSYANFVPCSCCDCELDVSSSCLICYKTCLHHYCSPTEFILVRMHQSWDKGLCSSGSISQMSSAAAQAGHMERPAALHGTELCIGPAGRLPQRCLAGSVRGWKLRQQSILGEGILGGCLVSAPVRSQ